MAHVGVDLDGVLYPFTDDARVVIAEYLNVDPLELDEPKVWDFMTEQWGIDQDTFWGLWFEDVARGRGWGRSDPAPGSVEGLLNLQAAGHTVHIVTSRKGGEVSTVKWIQDHNIPYDTLHIGRDKTRVNIDVLVDDWELNWIEATQAGTRCLVWDQPWNAHVTEAERVHSWDEVLEALT